MAVEEFEDARGRAGQREVDVPADAQDEAPEVDGVQAVGVLGGVDRLQKGGFLDAGRQRQLDDVSGAGRVGVQAVDGARDVLLGGGGREVDAYGGDADLGAVAVLAGHVGDRAGVLPHEHRSEAGGRAAFGEPGDAGRELGFEGDGGRLAVEDPGGHRAAPVWSRPG